MDKEWMISFSADTKTTQPIRLSVALVC